MGDYPDGSPLFSIGNCVVSGNFVFVKIIFALGFKTIISMKLFSFILILIKNILYRLTNIDFIHKANIMRVTLQTRRIKSA